MITEHTGGLPLTELFDTSCIDGSCIGCTWLQQVGEVDNPIYFTCYGDESYPKHKIENYNSCQIWCRYQIDLRSRVNE